MLQFFLFLDSVTVNYRVSDLTISFSGIRQVFLALSLTGQWVTLGSSFNLAYVWGCLEVGAATESHHRGTGFG